MRYRFLKSAKARAPVRRARTGSFAEPLEGRVLLSSYVLSTLGVFAAKTTGYQPNDLIMDAGGNLYGTTFRGGAGGVGTVFEIAAGSRTITTLASFDGTNLWDPDGLVLDGSGNLYGTTVTGGVGGDFFGDGDGTVFEIAAGSGTITTLAFFDGTNGALPIGGLVLDGGGNLYGTTQGGGDSNLGTVFEIAHGSGTITTLASMTATTGDDPTAVVLDGSGNLYGTAAGGGANSNGTVFELGNGSPTITTLASCNFTHGTSPDSIALDGSGNLYGTAQYGGDVNRYGTVFEVAHGTRTITTVGAFNGTNGAFPSGVVLDGSGNLYGTTGGGGANSDGTVFQIAHGTHAITTIASFDGTDGSGPNSVALDGSGDLYGTTAGGGDANGDGTVFELSPVKPRLPADFNGDGKQDFADLVILASNYGKNSATFADGDANGDGTVGFDDLVILAANYGRTVSASDLTGSGPAALGTPAAAAGLFSPTQPPASADPIHLLRGHRHGPPCAPANG